MTAAKSEFRKYIDSTQALPDDCVLGYVVIFQVRDAAYDRSIMEQTFDELGMNTKLLPAPNNPLHAFQKATSSVDDTDYLLPKTNGDPDICHVLVRDARSDNEVLTRHLTREIRDTRRGRLGYSQVGELVYYRPKVQGGKTQYGSERYKFRILMEALHQGERPALDAVVTKINEELNRHLNFMDAMKYRQVVREYLLWLNALKIKDGFYFVNANRKDELDKLSTLVERMGNGTTLWTMPLVDLGQQKQMVIEAYQNEAEAALQDVIKAINHVRSTRKSVTPDALQKLSDQYKAAVTRADEYRRTLKVRNTTTSATAELASELLADLKIQMMENA